MASTSLTLTTHWQEFIEAEVRSGRFTSASEVVRAALRDFEDRRKQLTLLQSHLAEGADQASRGLFVADFDVETLIRRAADRQ